MEANWDVRDDDSSVDGILASTKRFKNASEFADP